MKFDHAEKDYSKKVKASIKKSEERLYTMTTTLTGEIQYMNRRLKQKLLYQIGLTDDPWEDKSDVILDKCFSEDS